MIIRIAIAFQTAFILYRNGSFSFFSVHKNSEFDHARDDTNHADDVFFAFRVYTNSRASLIFCVNKMAVRYVFAVKYKDLKA